MKNPGPPVSYGSDIWPGLRLPVLKVEVLITVFAGDCTVEPGNWSTGGHGAPFCVALPMKLAMCGFCGSRLSNSTDSPIGTEMICATGDFVPLKYPLITPYVGSVTFARPVR